MKNNNLSNLFIIFVAYIIIVILIIFVIYVIPLFKKNEEQFVTSPSLKKRLDGCMNCRTYYYNRGTPHNKICSYYHMNEMVKNGKYEYDTTSNFDFDYYYDRISC